MPPSPPASNSPAVTSSTPGAIAVYGANPVGQGTHIIGYRLPTAADIQADIQAGANLSADSVLKAAGGAPGQVWVPGTTAYGGRESSDQARWVPGHWANPDSGGDGWLNSFLGDPLGTVSNTVSDFVQNPSHAIGEAWNTGGRDAAIAAGTVLAAMNGVDPTILSGLGETAGADALATLGSGVVEGGGLDALAAATDLTAGELAASELAAYPTSGIVGTIPAAATGALPITEALTEFGGYPSLAASEMAAYPTSEIVGTIPAAATGALPITAAAPSAAELVAAGTTEGGTLPTALGNEAVASGMSPGSLGAAAAAADVLTPTQLAAAAGAGGLGALTGADAATAALAASPNEMVASGLSPGAAGAAGAAAGILTPAQLAAAAGTTTGGLNLSDLAKGASTFNDLLNSFKKGAKLGSLDGSDSSGSGSRLGSDLARVGQMGSGNSLLHSVQGLYSGAPPGYAEGGSTSSGLDSYNSLKGDTVKVGDVGKSIPLTRELTSLYGDNALAHGGQPHVDPRLMALIRARANPADKQHPNYDGTPVFRTGGLEGLGGKYVEGKGDGQSDDIPAMLADGEYVFDAQTVADFGNGSNKAGAKMLDAMREAIRAHKRNSPLDSIPPKSKTPQQYLMDAQKYLKGVK